MRPILSLALAPLLLPACLDTGKDDDDDDGAELSAEAEEFVEAHNAVRAGVGVAELDWDDTVAASALAWAEALAADGCAFEHENQYDYGENLWWSSWDPAPTEVVDGWASEVAYYDYESNSCEPGEMCGHYTQVVWADTLVVGCGKATCEDGSVIWACRYDPPGNWVGEWPY